MNPLATIGYERDTLEGVIGRLGAANVEVLIDVRAIASSRRAGFSKTLLAASLAGAGIEYIHLRDLGTPKPGRDAARAGRIDEMRRIFSAHMAEPAAMAALARTEALVREKRACLLCFEADHARCHRAVLAGMLARSLRCEVVAL
ncbi:MAG: DUF488 domain-containing protein [Acetobacteraceae bacterium]|nr:DUF488 domain-containing protein [Acetobacteraceae bacterium]